jgi:hypothetical protein
MLHVAVLDAGLHVACRPSYIVCDAERSCKLRPCSLTQPVAPRHLHYPLLAALRRIARTAPPK